MSAETAIALWDAAKRNKIADAKDILAKGCDVNETDSVRKPPRPHPRAGVEFDHDQLDLVVYATANAGVATAAAACCCCGGGGTLSWVYSHNPRFF